MKQSVNRRTRVRKKKKNAYISISGVIKIQEISDGNSVNHQKKQIVEVSTDGANLVQ